MRFWGQVDGALLHGYAFAALDAVAAPVLERHGSTSFFQGLVTILVARQIEEIYFPEDFKAVQKPSSLGIHLSFEPCRKNRRHLRRIREREDSRRPGQIPTGNMAIRKEVRTQARSYPSHSRPAHLL